MLEGISSKGKKAKKEKVFRRWKNSAMADVKRKKNKEMKSALKRRD